MNPTLINIVTFLSMQGVNLTDEQILFISDSLSQMAKDIDRQVISDLEQASKQVYLHLN